jgi:SnoaL-like protein
MRVSDHIETTTTESGPAVTTVEDRMLIEDTLYRYASSIDSANLDRLSDVLHPDLWAQYGNAEPAEGADTVIGWIREATKTCVWQHHLLSVYHVDVQGDSATALVYHTSYQKFEGEDEVCLLVGRYHDELTRHEGTWKISRLVFEIMWGERRADTAGYLESVGGRGPKVPSWPS